jgi:RND family efflux transporter MFP subunit
MIARHLIPLAAALLFVNCRGHAVEEVETTAAAAVTVQKVAPQTVEGIVAAAGTVAAAPGADWTITAPEAARIIEMPKAEGDPVKPGDLLVRFEIPSIASDLATHRAEGEQAQARVENAQASVDRLTTLVQHGVAAQKELEDARRELAEAKAALAQAQSTLQNATVLESRTVVRARFPGVVARRAHNPGDMVDASASDVVLRIVDPARLQVVAAIAIADVRRVAAGNRARILMPGTDDSEEGRVLTKPAAVDPAGVSAPVRIAFKEQTRLPVGTPVRVEIVSEEHTNALAVPIEAVVHEEDATYVMIAGSDNKAHRRKVVLGLTTPKLAEVTQGLKAGDPVIVQGQQGLPDGAAINVAQ